MIFFQAKSDLKFINVFREDVDTLWNLEGTAIGVISSEPRRTYNVRDEFDQHVRAIASSNPQYQLVRQRVARSIDRASQIGRRGGNLFDIILRDPTQGDGIERQAIIDALDQTVGVAQERVRTDRQNLINPLYWVKALLVFILRLPFTLIELTGFNVSKVEDHFIGKLSKLVFGLLALYLLLRFGFEIEDIKDIIGVFRRNLPDPVSLLGWIYEESKSCSPLAQRSPST